MAGPYDITLPVQGQPISSSGFGIPVKDAIEDLDARLSIREALENLPDEAAAFISTVIAITSTTFATLPSPGPLSLAFTNPSSEFDLLGDLTFSAWLNPNGASNVQGGVAASGGMTWNANQFGVGGPAANSDNLFVGGASITVQQQTSYTVKIPAGAAAVTFTMHALRGSTGGSPAFNYPVLRFKPRAYLVP